MSNQLPGECCICHLCELPIVGEIVSLGGGTVACDYCANVYYDESGEWEEDYNPAEYEPDYDEQHNGFDYWDSYDYGNE